MKTPSSQWIALICILFAVGLTVYIFAASRHDPGLRMAALVSATGVVTTVLAIASLTLTGKDLAHPQPPELPPNSSGTTRTSSEQVIQTVTPPAAIPPAALAPAPEPPKPV